MKKQDKNIKCIETISNESCTKRPRNPLKCADNSTNTKKLVFVMIVFDVVCKEFVTPYRFNLFS